MHLRSLMSCSSTTERQSPQHCESNHKISSLRHIPVFYELDTASCAALRLLPKLPLMPFFFHLNTLQTVTNPKRSYNLVAVGAALRYINVIMLSLSRCSIVVCSSSVSIPRSNSAVGGTFPCHHPPAFAKQVPTS